jgi:glycosyltransferase involved in cell wall biosynthesis
MRGLLAVMIGGCFLEGLPTCGTNFSLYGGSCKANGIQSRCHGRVCGAQVHAGHGHYDCAFRLRVLCVGEADLRKGISYAAETARRRGDAAEIKWIGPISLLPNARRLVEPHVKLTGPTPRNMMAAEFQWADVFFLPSACEGSATVTYEALMSGLPVITTPNAGGVVIDGSADSLLPHEAQTRWPRDFDICTCVVMYYLKCRMRRAPVERQSRLKGARAG